MFGANVMRDALGRHDVATVALGAGETLPEELFEEVVMASLGPGYLAAPGRGVIATVVTMIIGIWVVRVYRDITGVSLAQIRHTTEHQTTWLFVGTSQLWQTNYNEQEDGDACEPL